MRGFNPTSVLEVRETCRTIVDALDLLGVPDIGGNAVATIHAGEILCPNGETPGMVFIGTGFPDDEDRRYVRLPDSNIFRGALSDGTPMRGAIQELAGAVVGSDGTISLSDGRLVRKVEVQPGIPYRHYDLTMPQYFIVKLAVRLLGAEDTCYRVVDEKLLPGLRWLDYRAIRQIRPRHVERLYDRIQQFSCMRISKQEIEIALRLAGFQFLKVQQALERSQQVNALNLPQWN